jgi:hypothetical protein
VKADFSTIATANEAYYVDNNAYAPQGPRTHAEWPYLRDNTRVYGSDSPGHAANNPPVSSHAHIVPKATNLRRGNRHRLRTRSMRANKGNHTGIMTNRTNANATTPQAMTGRRIHVRSITAPYSPDRAHLNQTGSAFRLNKM